MQVPQYQLRSAGILRSQISKLANAILSDKELAILNKINGETASMLSEKCSMPRSTFWFNLRKLKSKGLLTFGNSNPICLTHLGELIFPAIAQLAERSAVATLLEKASMENPSALEGQRNREVAGASLARGISAKALIKSDAGKLQ